MELTEFLLARIAEDEAVAERCIRRNSFGDIASWHAYRHQAVAADLPRGAVAVPAPGFLAECEAKRLVIARLVKEHRTPKPGVRFSKIKRRITDGIETVTVWSAQVDLGQTPIDSEAMTPAEFDERYTVPDPEWLKPFALPYADHPDYQPEWATDSSG